MTSPIGPLRLLRATVGGRQAVLRPLPDDGRRDVPSAPTGFTVVRDDVARTATMTWRPPTDDGRSIITGYRVARDGVDASGDPPYTSPLLPAATRSFVMTDLAPDVLYNLTVRAVNAQGPGAVASAPVTLTAGPAGVPSIPTAVVVTKDDATNTATITWRPPVSDGGAAITGYRVARDGTDSAGTGAYSTVVDAATVTFTVTRLVGGSTYRLTVQAVNENGPGPAAGGAVTLAADPTGGVQKTGPQYVLEQDLTGDLHQKMNGHSLILSLQAKVYRESDFDRPYGSTTTVQKPDGSGLNPTAYWSMMYQGKTVRGLVGAGMDRTVIEIAPNSDTKASNPYGLDGTDGRTKFGSNYKQLWAVLDQPVDLLYEDFTISGTAQTPVPGSPDGKPLPVALNGNDNQGKDYNGWYLARPKGNVTVRNVRVRGVPGSGSSPPGETFIVNLLGLPAGKTARFENLWVDGTRAVDGKKVGSAGLGLNTINGLVEVVGGRFDDTRYSAGIAAWKISSTAVINLRKTRMFGMRRTLGAEAVEGVINVYDPVWGDVQDTRFDINLTWAKTSATRIYKNGKINFYFSSEQAWLDFKNARGKFVHSVNRGRQGLIRVVTNTFEDYGFGRLPSGTYEDPRKCVLVWFFDASRGVYVQRDANLYVDFFGENRTTY